MIAKNKDDLIEKYDLGCAMMIFSFNTDELSTKDLILRNFLAKSISQLKTITILNNLGQIFDCYIIYRTMVDRLGHLYYLERTNSFEDFESWSFVRQYESNNNSLSDINFKDRINKDLFKPIVENKNKYAQIKKQGIKWKRPDVEEEFKQKDLYFLYKFGYDHASTHVHPMSNDGMIEYYRMIKDPPPDIVEHYLYQKELITKNSALVSSLTVNECLNFSSFEWRAVAFKFIESFRQAINSEPNEFDSNFLKMKAFIDDNSPIGKKISLK